MMKRKTIVYKKAAALLVCLLLAVAAGGLCVHAEEAFDYQAQYEASGADRLYDNLPDYALEGLDKAGVDSGEFSSIAQLDHAAVLNSVMGYASDEMNAPLASLGMIIALLLFASVCKEGGHSLTCSMSPSVNVIISLAVGITLVTHVVSVINAAGDAVDTGCRFMQSFGAVFAGILIANGQTVSAAGYSTFLFGAIDAASICVDEIIMPMLRIILALSCVSALSENVRIDGIIRFFDKYAKWLLGFLAVIISTVLSISGLLSASADSVGARAAKFVISGSVPVVGGAVSEAYLSIKTGMALLRNSVGAFGIIGVGYIFLPVIIRTLLWNFVAGVGESVCETLELGDVQKLMKSVSAVLSLMLGVLVFSLFLLTLGSIIVIMQRSA